MTFIEVTQKTSPDFAGVFQAFAEDNEIIYTRNIKGYVKSLGNRRIAGDGMSSATLGSLITHEIGHTSTALRAIGHNSVPVYSRAAQKLEELRAAAVFENTYRRQFEMPLRRTYLKKNDVLSFDPSNY